MRLWLLLLALLAACTGKVDDPGTGDDTDPSGSGEDSDGDGFSPPDDCDDENVDISPVALEYCDEVDNDCDGEIDEDSAVDAEIWCQDADLDGYGDPDSSCTSSCEPVEGLANNTDDCSDIDARVNPEGQEKCDVADVDEDCDGLVDDADDSVDPDSLFVYYPDADGDGYGDADGEGTTTCEDPSTTSDRYADNAWDCDDQTRRTSPDEEEDQTDGIDNDCDGAIDEDGRSGVTLFYYGDAEEPDDLYCEVHWNADWGRKHTPCDDCEWAFTVVQTLDESAGYGASTCGADDMTWTLAWNDAAPAYMYYYVDNYEAWYAIFAATFDEDTDVIRFAYGVYAYPYFGYYFTRYWYGYADLAPYLED